jgi:hypothetical protein
MQVLCGLRKGVQKITHKIKPPGSLAAGREQLKGMSSYFDYITITGRLEKQVFNATADSRLFFKLPISRFSR